MRQELASAKRSLDRYFAAFEEGSLSPADCQERIAKLKARIDALIAEEASLTLRAAEGATEVASATDVAEWAEDLGTLLRAGTAQQRKALFRLLVKELRVMSREEILPTYKIPALVRAPEGQVEVRGFEPLASAVRRQRSTGLSYTPGTSGSVAEASHTSASPTSWDGAPRRSSLAWRSSASRRSFWTTEIERSPRVFSIKERETSVARRRFIVIASG